MFSYLYVLREDSKRYLDNIRRPIVHAYVAAVGENCILTDDARPHRDRLGEVFFNEVGIEIMDWPAYSQSQ